MKLQRSLRGLRGCYAEVERDGAHFKLCVLPKGHKENHTSKSENIIVKIYRNQPTKVAQRYYVKVYAVVV